MPSNSPTRFPTAATFSATVVAVATVTGLVAYFNGDTYTNGVQEAVTLSGASIYRGGAQHQGVVCRQTGGLLGSCSNAPNAQGDCNCGTP